jgi:hypothetical protein
LRYKHVFAVLFIVLAAGCATLPVSSREITEFTIKPEKGITPGAYVTVVVRTSVPVEKVTAYVDVMGFPKIALKYSASKKAWFFGVPIPAVQQLPKGEYTAKVEAVSKSGEIFTAEKKISTY